MTFREHDHSQPSLLNDRQIESLFYDFTESVGLVPHTPSKLVNQVDGSTFNYSIEEPLLLKYGGYSRIAEPLDVAIVQPCIRTGDFARNRRTRAASTHSSLFHAMALQYEFVPDPTALGKMQRKGAARLYSFLINKLRLDPRRIFVTYFSGGYADEILGAARSERIYFPPDKLTPLNFTEVGFLSENMLPQASEANMLATFVTDEEFYAGTKLELLYEIRGEKIEFGTGELINHFQRRLNGRLIDIVPLEASGAPIALGLERCLAALSDNPNLFELGFRRNVVVALAEELGINRDTCQLVADALLPALCVLGQFTYLELSSSFQGRVRSFMAAIRSHVPLPSLPLERIISAVANELPRSLILNTDQSLAEFSRLALGAAQ